VGGDFKDIVGGVGVGLGEVSDDDFVDAGGICGASLGWTAGGGRPYVICGNVSIFAGGGARATRFDQFTEHGSAGFQRVLEAQHGLGNLACFGAGKTNNTNAAASGRSGNGDDGVVEIHEKSGG
jgi:hypothetical protein